MYNYTGIFCYFYKGDDFCDFLFAILHVKPFLKKDKL